MEFPRQEYWSELPFPIPGDLPNTGIKPASLASPWQGDSLPPCHLESLSSAAGIRAQSSTDLRPLFQKSALERETGEDLESTVINKNSRFLNQRCVQRRQEYK